MASYQSYGSRRLVTTHATDSKHNLPIAANILDREFNPVSPNIAWVASSSDSSRLKLLIDAAASNKVLGFRSPHEVLFGVEMRYTKPALAVALRS